MESSSNQTGSVETRSPPSVVVFESAEFMAEYDSDSLSMPQIPKQIPQQEHSKPLTAALVQSESPSPGFALTANHDSSANADFKRAPHGDFAPRGSDKARMSFSKPRRNSSWEWFKASLPKMNGGKKTKTLRRSYRNSYQSGTESTASCYISQEFGLPEKQTEIYQKRKWWKRSQTKLDKIERMMDRTSGSSWWKLNLTKSGHMSVIESMDANSDWNDDMENVSDEKLQESQTKLAQNETTNQITKFDSKSNLAEWDQLDMTTMAKAFSRNNKNTMGTEEKEKWRPMPIESNFNPIDKSQEWNSNYTKRDEFRKVSSKMQLIERYEEPKPNEIKPIRKQRRRSSGSNGESTSGSRTSGKSRQRRDSTLRKRQAFVSDQPSLTGIRRSSTVAKSVQSRPNHLMFNQLQRSESILSRRGGWSGSQTSSLSSNTSNRVDRRQLSVNHANLNGIQKRCSSFPRSDEWNVSQINLNGIQRRCSSFPRRDERNVSQTNINGIEKRQASVFRRLKSSRQSLNRSRSSFRGRRESWKSAQSARSASSRSSRANRTSTIVFRNIADQRFPTGGRPQVPGVARTDTFGNGIYFLCGVMVTVLVTAMSIIIDEFCESIVVSNRI